MKIFWNRLLYFLPIPFFMILINYNEDPANLFNKNYEAGIADYLVQGNNVTNVVNYNDRALQKLLIEKLKKCPTEIVLGSSRIMQVSSKYSTKDIFINNGVSGATLEDYFAIYNLYEKRECKIQKIMIGLDPWILNDNTDQKRWRGLGSEYNEFMRKLYNDQDDNFQLSIYKYEKYTELLSFSYFKTSLNYLTSGIKKDYYPTEKDVNVGFTRLKDGSVSYDSIYGFPSKSELAARVQGNLASVPFYGLGDFSKLSENYKNLLNDFIYYLQQNNIEIEFFLSPYHPAVYNYFKNNSTYTIVLDAEKYFKDFAEKHKIKVSGSYDPSVYKLDETYFYDGLHCNEKAIRIIIASGLQNKSK